jgi:MoxR-like ATPase
MEAVMMDVKENTTTNYAQQSLLHVRHTLEQRIIGQQALIVRMLIALLADGHILIEGPPGLAKTTAAKTLADCISASFQRIQFTPDLLPADLTGTDIFRPQDGSFSFQPGPVFHNLILADEINRAPAKVQSALLEAMAEKQVTIGNTQHPLPDLFMVIATQNPLEQEGTYPLPEAQLDRFLLYVKIDYPRTAKVESAILDLNRQLSQHPNNKADNLPTITQTAISQIRNSLFDVHLSDALQEYIIQLVLATRDPKPYSHNLASWLRFGASPRASMGLERCARAHAWLNGRTFVSPEDIHAVAQDVLRHRILLNFSARAENICSEDYIEELLRLVPIP